MSDSSGTRLGRMMASEPELTRPALTDADREFLRSFADYICGDGFDCGAMVTRMERLKFETIVTGKSYREVLDARQSEPPLQPMLQPIGSPSGSSRPGAVRSACSSSALVASIAARMSSSDPVADRFADSFGASVPRRVR